MSGYKRFDRHEVFSMDDTSFVLDCINKTKWDKEDGAAELTNMLFGLFDGYYYDKRPLESAVINTVCNSLLQSQKEDI